MESGEILEKRDALKQMLQPGAGKTLFSVLITGADKIIRKLTRHPVPLPDWIVGVFLSLITLLIIFLISLLLNEEYADLPIKGRFGIVLIVWGIGFAYAFFIILKTYADRQIFPYLRDYLIDYIQRERDLDELKAWIEGLFNIKSHLGFSLLVAIVLTSSINFWFYKLLLGSFIGYGLLLFFFIVNGVGGSLIYFILKMALLPIHIGQFHLRLFNLDPESSEIIEKTSDVFNSFILVVSLITIFIVFSSAVVEQLFVVNLILVFVIAFGPLIALFITSQHTLQKTITRAKWQTLNELQKKIEHLQNQEDIPSPDTLEHLNKLTDYHNRIKNTRNTSLDLRATLNFITSLLLPLASFVLANLDQVLALF
jgi:hypothetical protein